MKNGPLKSLAGDLGADLAQDNRSNNPPIREVIRGFIGGERQEIELKVDGGLGTEDNLKAIWSSIRKLLPIYTLFKTDKSFDDKDSDVKSPLQAAIDEALGLPEIQALLEEVESKVKEYSTNVAEKTIEKLKNFDASLSESMKSEFGKSPSYGKVFDLTLLNAENIPLNKRGSGIRRLVVLSFFQAQAEKRKMDEGAPAIIYGIEEPETSQHPNHQKMIISSLSDLSAQENVQVLFTTHSANLVKEIPIASLRYISATPDSQILVEYGDKQDDGTHDDAVIDKIVNALGILPNPAEKISVLVYVEGNNDVSALKRYSKILHEDDAAVLDIGSSESVGYVITGGSALKHYIEQKHLHGLGKPEVHIYDNDVADYRRYVDVINTAGNPNRVGFNTTKTELENYLHSDAISEAYASSGQDGIEFDIIDDDIDVPLMVAQRVYQAAGGSWNDLPEDKQKKKSDEKKKLLNTAAVEAMTVERLRDRNGYDDIRSWLEKIAHFV